MATSRAAPQPVLVHTLVLQNPLCISYLYLYVHKSSSHDVHVYMDRIQNIENTACSVQVHRMSYVVCVPPVDFVYLIPSGARSKLGTHSDLPAQATSRPYYPVTKRPV